MNPIQKIVSCCCYVAVSWSKPLIFNFQKYLSSRFKKTGNRVLSQVIFLHVQHLQKHAISRNKITHCILGPNLVLQQLSKGGVLVPGPPLCPLGVSLLVHLKHIGTQLGFRMGLIGGFWGTLRILVRVRWGFIGGGDNNRY